MLKRVGNTAAAVHQEKRISQEENLFMLFLELALCVHDSLVIQRWAYIIKELNIQQTMLER
jgi:hypothetical protein